MANVPEQSCPRSPRPWFQLPNKQLYLEQRDGCRSWFVANSNTLLTFPGSKLNSGPTCTWTLPPSTHSNSSVCIPSKLTVLPTRLTIVPSQFLEWRRDAFSRGKAPSAWDMVKVEVDDLVCYCRWSSNENVVKSMMRCWLQPKKKYGLVLFGLKNISDDDLHITEKTGVFRVRHYSERLFRTQFECKLEFLRIFYF